MKRNILKSLVLLSACLFLAACGTKEEFGQTGLKGIEVSYPNEGSVVSINLGSTAKTPAYPIPWDCTDYEFTYTSSNPDVVSVDQYGNLKGEDTGDATITVSGGGYTASVNVNVYEVTIGQKLQQLDGLTGLWEFSQPDVYKATVGTDLVPYRKTKVEQLKHDAGDICYEPSGYNQMTGFNKRDGAVLSTLLYSLLCHHGLTNTSVYTLVVDVLYPSSSFGKYTTILQINAADDQAIYFRKQGYTQFCSGDNRSTNAVSPDQWYRCVFVKNGTEYMRTYVNGVLWNEGGATSEGVLAPDICYLDGDNDGDDRELGWSTAAFFNRPLTLDEIQALGAP